MKITAIKQQAKRQDRYSIFVDEKYAFSLSESELISSGVHSGQELSAKELSAFKERSKLDKIYGLVLNLVVRRPRSRKELSDYLYRKGQDKDAAESIINRLSVNGLVDDESFARSWVENRRLLKLTSIRKLKLELRQKGIPDDIVQSVLSVDETSDLATLKQLIESKRRQTKYKDDQKLMQYLARQGFGYSDIKEALQAED